MASVKTRTKKANGAADPTKPLKRPSPFMSVGRTGLKFSAGRIFEEWHPKLRGDFAVRVYREMSDNDPVIGAFLYAIESLVRQVTWQAKPANRTPEAQQWRKFLKDNMEGMTLTWPDFIGEALSMLIYGWSYFETVYRPGDGGRVFWKKHAIRSQDSVDRWEIDDDGNILGFWQRVQFGEAAGDISFIPIEKSLLFRTKCVLNNPEGRSLLRNSFRSWFLLKRIQEIEAIGIERDLAGLPVLQVPPELMSANPGSDEATLRTQLEQLIQHIKRDEHEGVLIPAETDAEGKPTGYKLSLLSTGGSRQLRVNDTIKRYEGNIAMSVMAEFLLLGLQKVGSFALASSKTDLFAMSIGWILDNMAATLNRFAVPRLMQLNGVPREHWPTIVHSDIEKQDITELTQFVTQLSDRNLLGEIDEGLKLELRRRGNLPLPEAEEEIEVEAEIPTDVPEPKKAEAEAVAPEPEAPTAAIEPSAQALNGAQVTAILDVLNAINTGHIPRASGVNTLVAAFSFTPEQAEAVIGDIGTDAFTPPPPPAKE